MVFIWRLPNNSRTSITKGRTTIRKGKDNNVNIKPSFPDCPTIGLVRQQLERGRTKVDKKYISVL